MYVPSAAERANPRLFADNVRAAMLAAGGLLPSPATLADCRAYLALSAGRAARVPAHSRAGRALAGQTPSLGSEGGPGASSAGHALADERRYPHGAAAGLQPYPMCVDGLGGKGGSGEEGSRIQICVDAGAHPEGAVRDQQRVGEGFLGRAASDSRGDNADCGVRVALLLPTSKAGDEGTCVRF